MTLDPQKMHALLVHLPLGLVIVSAPACLFAVLADDRRLFRRLSLALFAGISATAFLVSWTGTLALSSDAAVLTESAQRTLFLHKRAGESLPFAALLTVLCLAIMEIARGHTRKIARGAALLACAGTVVVAVFTGLKGGSLVYDYGVGVRLSGTHDGQSEHPLVSVSVLQEVKNRLSDLTEGQVARFSSEIEPILNSKCVACHNAYIRSGGLDLSSYGHMMGKKDLVVPGSPETSTLALTVCEAGNKRMPPAGAALSETEVRQVAIWIADGAKNN